MPVLLSRTVLTFVFVMIVSRWTGKRSISNLAPFDLAMVIMIGEVAVIPIGELDVDFLHGLDPRRPYRRSARGSHHHQPSLEGV